MKVVVKYQCPSCGDTFKFPKEAPEPNYCPLCGAFVGPEDPDFVPERMTIGGSAIAKSVDQTYRQYEQATAEMAEAHGNPQMKVTNMKDNLREGDVAAVPVRTQLHAMQDEMKWNNWAGGGAGGGNTVSIENQLAMVKTGQERTTGSVALAAIQGETTRPPAVPSGIRGSWGGG